MSKGGSSETTKSIPDWLAPMLKPLLRQSTAGLKAFGQQGQDVLHGFKPRGVNPRAITNPKTPAGKLSRAELLELSADRYRGGAS